MTDEKDDQTAVPESSFDKFIRDEQGRFAKADEPAPPADAPAPQDAQPPAPPPTASPQQPAAGQPTSQPQPGKQWVDVALLDEREKRRQERERADKESARAAELERRLREFEEKQTKAPPPDPIADPEGFQRALDAQRLKDRQETKFLFSEKFAAQKHGAEVVKSAMEWLGQELQANPALWSSIETHPDPAEHVVQLHKRHLWSAKLGDVDPDEYARKWAELNGYVLPQATPGTPVAAASSPQPPKPPPPRPSIASAPAAAPVAVQDSAYNEAEVFKGVFGNK